MHPPPHLTAQWTNNQYRIIIYTACIFNKLLPKYGQELVHSNCKKLYMYFVFAEIVNCVKRV